MAVDAVEAFAQEAARFGEWARFATSAGAAAAREALVGLVRLYGAALALPREWSDGLDARVPAAVDDDEVKAVASAASSRLPLDMYGEVFDPLPVPAEEPVVGSLVDDLSDIYRDVATGLWLYNGGHREEALWQWAFTFRIHWGEHATGAIRALHCWLVAHAPSSFTSATGDPKTDHERSSS
jgi:hypothetical protein